MKEKKARYQPYADTISERVPWLKEQIRKSKDGFIYIRECDMKEALGNQFRNKHFLSILAALKFVLFEECIIVKQMTRTDGERLFLMRFGNEDDVLPPSLAKLIIFDI